MSLCGGRGGRGEKGGEGRAYGVLGDEHVAAREEEADPGVVAVPHHVARDNHVRAPLAVQRHVPGAVHVVVADLHADRSLPARSLLQLLEECTPDACKSRAAHGAPDVGAGVAHVIPREAEGVAGLNLEVPVAPELDAMPDDVAHGVVGHDAHAAEGQLDAAPVRNDTAGILRRMQPRCQRYRGSLPDMGHPVVAEAEGGGVVGEDGGT